MRAAGRLTLDPAVTFMAGDNGAGKSTLIEAIAVAASFNPEGGSINFRFSTRATCKSKATAPSATSTTTTHSQRY